MPGTFPPDNDNIQQSTDPTGEKITVDSVSTTMAVMVESTTEISVFAVGSTLFYVLICSYQCRDYFFQFHSSMCTHWPFSPKEEKVTS